MLLASFFSALFSLTGLLVVIHVLDLLALVLLVLLHSGRGGGLSDMFGGVGAVAAGSTTAERNLDRATVFAALIFAFTTIALGLRLQ